MIIGVTGFRGRLGSWLVKKGCTPFDCDITDVKSIRQEMEETKPDVIINCAAYTKVDEAEKDADTFKKVLKVNMWGPARLRQEFDGLLIQISTGHIFNGSKGPYSEEGKPGPINVYGWSKYAGEVSAKMRNPTLIIRVYDLYGVGPKADFVRYTRDIIQLGTTESFSTRLYGTPTFIPHLSEAILEVANRGLTGTLHLASDAQSINRYQWAKMIVEYFELEVDLVKPTSEVLGEAPRPLRGGLAVDKARLLGLPLYTPPEGLAALKDWEQKRAEEELPISTS